VISPQNNPGYLPYRRNNDIIARRVFTKPKTGTMKSAIVLPTYTAKSSSKRGTCLTAGTGLDVSQNSRQRLPSVKA
jgi:hypothetical protein